MFLYVHFSDSLSLFFFCAAGCIIATLLIPVPEREEEKKNSFKTSEKMLSGSSSLKELY